ncbi:MAG: ATP-binding protein [Candidatus Thiodiazotropha lotti]|nr:ATP-binding protein [Candidatus Thiodiazotropha lotti]MCW4218702.1 ATP-binding protein [Candidatus Thiodiazotropha lotti]
MSDISRFEITGLHGFKNIDLRFRDNTLILVGENGAGKTTVLHLLYYLLSGQWSAMAKYKFEYLRLTIGNTKHIVNYSDIKDSLLRIDKKILHNLPLNVRHRVLALLEQTEGQLPVHELEELCDHYNIPLHYLIGQLDLFDNPRRGKPSALSKKLDEIISSLGAQLLYLPTYRRIEQELNLIFKGLDERELKNRRRMLASRRNTDNYVELVEFGMKDVEFDIRKTQEELDKFARENLNTLTFSYLGDIVEKKYESVDLLPIKEVDQKTIDNILNRIQEPVLSQDNKRHLKKIIQTVKDDSTKLVHSQVICHYFTKLMAFHEELEKKETKIVNFCKACNNYMVDKEFQYNTSSFNFRIVPKPVNDVDREIELQNLSSGEKQIVSLFSHLYLSGGKKYFVLIDEPELSLSVDWQRKFVSDIRKADFCTGIVAVTHSPFIYDNDLREYAHGLGEFIV